ncbi:hypothetical protein [Eikenella longinqua]|uniref:hypothetical protein n=1 Tax=Eikenella longinqua TaxID=1795827 RepID=UPI0012E80A3A|nr:hypothetical protein [Eikenella longinqua]
MQQFALLGIAAAFLGVFSVGFADKVADHFLGEQFIDHDVQQVAIQFFSRNAA